MRKRLLAKVALRTAVASVAAAAVLPAIPAVAATPSTPVSVSAGAKPMGPIPWRYPYEGGLEFSTCQSWGAFFTGSGQSSSFECLSGPTDHGLYTLWLYGQV